MLFSKILYKMHLFLQYYSIYVVLVVFLTILEVSNGLVVNFIYLATKLLITLEILEFELNYLLLVFRGLGTFEGQEVIDLSV